MNTQRRRMILKTDGVEVNSVVLLDASVPDFIRRAKLNGYEVEDGGAVTDDEVRDRVNAILGRR